MASSTVKVVGLGGGISSMSLSLNALKIALAGAAEASAETELFDINTLNLPMYSPELDERPEAAQRLCDAVHEAQAMIWSSPVYHGSISGSFKNAIDWMESLSERTPSYLTNKVVGLVVPVGGVPGLQVINTMDAIVRALHGYSVPLLLPIARPRHVFDRKGNIDDPSLETELRDLGKEVVRAAMQWANENVNEYDVTTVSSIRMMDVIDVVDQASQESFPASDSPAW